MQGDVQKLREDFQRLADQVAQILTARGGVSSHAALVARQMGKVCVCGASAVNVDYQARTVSGSSSGSCSRTSG